MVQVFRCKICGEAFVANNKSTHCPFCGAPIKWLVDAKEYKEPEVLELSEVSRKNLEFTYDLEVKAARIYHCMRKKSKDEFIVGMMKALSKVELEHAELVGKLIGKDPGCEIPFQKELCTEDRKESLERTKELEEDAVKHYKKFLEEAKEQRVKDIFEALINAEEDHIKITEENL
ncbi:ferritin [Candidatus Woesearchaeota archaeon]|nr:ferritin [Candidatus Woesearchaeota archaeon]